MFNPDFDVAVIGGGPAGASMGAYLGRAGAKVVVLERALFPRPHVGESLVPSSTRVFKDLNFLDKMEAARFPKKFGAIWTSTFSKTQYTHEWEGLGAQQFADIRFDERQQPGVEKDYTFHVDRGIFDSMLLQHAEELGANVYQGVGVERVDFESDCARVRFSMGKRPMDLTARIVVDASGRNTLMGTQMRWKVRDPVFDQIAVHAWFEDFDRHKLISDPRHEAYIHVHFLNMTNSWIWQIPITDRITSIGVVTQKRHLQAKGNKTPAEFFWDCLTTRPELHDALKASTQIRPFKAEGDYSYAMDEISGDRLVMIGDAARFVDPIFSTGVSIALNSSRLASPDILKALETGNTSKESFANYVGQIRRGTKNWYDFISVYYRLNVLFTAFVQNPKYRLDVLKLLQGDVYDDASPAVLNEMRKIVTQVERNEKHPWHALLGSLTGHAYAPQF